MSQRHDEEMCESDFAFEAKIIESNQQTNASKNSSKLTFSNIVQSSTSIASSSSSNANPFLNPVQYMPVMCPVGKCKAVLTSDSVLAHYLADHKGLQFQKAIANEPITMTIDYNSMQLGQNCCLGVLGFSVADMPEERKQCLSETGALRHNESLKNYGCVDTNLPLLIMACRTSWKGLSNDPTPATEEEEVLFLWLSSTLTTERIYCTLTVYDKFLFRSSSAIVLVRDLCDSQNTSEFTHDSTDFLRVVHGEVKNLSNGGTASIYLDVQITEFD